MRPASKKETKNVYNDENYITPRTLRAALANYSPSGGGSSEGGTTDYNKLENKPSINGVTLSQNKTLKDLGIQPEGAYLTEVPDTYKTKDENDNLYQPKGSYQPAGSYQETLVSGDNIKTVNGQSLLGEGDLTIAGGSGGLIDTLPVGTMIPYGSAETPDNWLSCNGQAVSRTTYSHLFAVIGTSYGAGDDSTTFNLPDKRGRVSVGYDPDQELFNKVGAHVGANTHTLTIAEMPSHQHDMYEVNPSTGGGSYKQNYTNGGNYQVTLGSCKTVSEQGYFGLLGQFKTGGGQAHSIVQASEVDHWIIKAFPLSSPEGALDSLPIGTIVEYDGEEVPDGFEELEEVLDYSTTEQKIGTWINGKTLYRKVINVPISSITGAGTMISHGVSNLECAVSHYCAWYDTQAETWRNMPSSYFGSLDWSSQVLVRTDGNLYFEIGPSALTRLQTKGKDLFVIIEYTKTTD